MTIKNNLKIVRKNKKLTQREVARRANLSLMGYIKIERGVSIPNLSNAFRIAKAIGERLENLFVCKDKK